MIQHNPEDCHGNEELKNKFDGGRMAFFTCNYSFLLGGRPSSITSWADSQCHEKKINCSGHLTFWCVTAIFAILSNNSKFCLRYSPDSTPYLLKPSFWILDYVILDGTSRLERGTQVWQSECHTSLLTATYSEWPENTRWWNRMSLF